MNTKTMYTTEVLSGRYYALVDHDGEVGGFIYGIPNQERLRKNVQELLERGYVFTEITHDQVMPIVESL